MSNKCQLYTKVIIELATKNMTHKRNTKEISQIGIIEGKSMW